MAHNALHDVFRVVQLAAIYPRETEYVETMKGLRAIVRCCIVLVVKASTQV